MSLAKRLIELRERLGINQKQLSEASGINQATISRIERGQVQDIMSASLTRLAGALGTTADYLSGKSTEFTPSDLIRSDDTAKEIFSGYASFSPELKNELKDFAKYLTKKQELERQLNEGLWDHKTDVGSFRSRVLDAERRLIMQNDTLLVRYDCTVEFAEFAGGHYSSSKSKTAASVKEQKVRSERGCGSHSHQAGYAIDEPAILRQAIRSACEEAFKKLTGKDLQVAEAEAARSKPPL